MLRDELDNHELKDGEMLLVVATRALLGPWGHCKRDPTARGTPLQEGPAERQTLWGIARGTPRGIARGIPCKREPTGCCKGDHVVPRWQDTGYTGGWPHVPPASPSPALLVLVAVNCSRGGDLSPAPRWRAGRHPRSPRHKQGALGFGQQPSCARISPFPAPPSPHASPRWLSPPGAFLLLLLLLSFPNRMSWSSATWKHHTRPSPWSSTHPGTEA